MVTFEEAKAIALASCGGFDYYSETKDAFVFGKHDEESDGGNGPAAIMKESGECLDFVWYLSEGGSTEIIKEGHL